MTLAEKEAEEALARIRARIQALIDKYSGPDTWHGDTRTGNETIKSDNYQEA